MGLSPTWAARRRFLSPACPAMLATIGAVKHKFHSSGYPQFFVDPKQIVTHGVFAETELLGDLPIGQTLCDETPYLPFPPRKEVAAVRIGYPNWFFSSKCL